jgi:hypothetical protein
VPTTESIRKKYASQLAGATPEKKVEIQEQMAQELRRSATTLSHQPSAQTLW